MLAQTVTDSAGWGAAEWIAVATVIATLVTAITTLVIQVMKLRRENTTQHAESRQIVTDVRDRLLDLHTSVEHVDRKVDSLDDRLDRHESLHHRGKRRW